MQANKAGLLEVADIFVINKADRPGVAESPAGPRADARPVGAGRLAAARSSRRRGRPGEGVEELWAEVAGHRRFLAGTGAARGRAGRPGSADELRRVLAGPPGRCEVEELAGRTASPAARGAWPSTASTPTRRPTGCWGPARRRLTATGTGDPPVPGTRPRTRDAGSAGRGPSGTVSPMADDTFVTWSAGTTAWP